MQVNGQHRLVGKSGKLKPFPAEGISVAGSAVGALRRGRFLLK